MQSATANIICRINSTDCRFADNSNVSSFTLSISTNATPMHVYQHWNRWLFFTICCAIFISFLITKLFFTICCARFIPFLITKLFTMNFTPPKWVGIKWKVRVCIIPPLNEVSREYSGFTLSSHLSVHAAIHSSICLSKMTWSLEHSSNVLLEFKFQISYIHFQYHCLEVLHCCG